MRRLVVSLALLSAVAVGFAGVAVAPAASAAPPADYEPGGCIDNDGIGADPFIDVPSAAFYHDAVEWAYANGIVAGVDGRRFVPSGRITRGEFAAMLHRMACLPPAAGTADFDDVLPVDFFAAAVDWMVGEGITVGLTEDTFGPQEPMSRGEFAAFLWRFVGRPEASPVNPFGDVDRAAFFAPAVDWLLHRSVTTGTSPTTFSPWLHITRAEVAAFLHRLHTIGDVNLRFETVATRAAPTAAATDPTTGAVFVTERAGRVFRYPAGGDGRPNWGAGSEVLDLSGPIGQSGEGGLLGVAVAPDGGALYLSFTDNAGDSNIRRYALSGGVPTGAPVTTFGPLFQPQTNHNGGQIVFGPDGHLYASFGDGGGGNDDDAGHTLGVGNGQDASNLLGAILRLAPLAGGGYTIPTTPVGNPYPSAEEPAGRPEIWSIGVRNPWRFTFDAATGDLWVADVGQDAREEITRLRADDVPGVAGGRGANLGWRLREGDIATPGVGGPLPGAIDPVHVYGGHSACRSITGGYVYRGDDIPALWGTYLYGDYCRDNLLRGWRDAYGVESESLGVAVPGGNLVSFLEDGTGEIYSISLNGTIARLTRATS